MNRAPDPLPTGLFRTSEIRTTVVQRPTVVATHRQTIHNKRHKKCMHIIREIYIQGEGDRQPNCDPVCLL